METKQKQLNRSRRHARLRAKIYGTATRPRIAVFKSNQYVYVQAIDDEAHKTVASFHDIDLKPSKAPKDLGSKAKYAFEAGLHVAEALQKLGIKQAVFDKGGFKYHGRIKAVAEAMREAGVKI